MPSVNYPDGASIDLPSGIKAHINDGGFDVPVVATGKIRTPELAERFLVEGKADLIGMARALLADPDWPRKVRDGQGDRVVHCIYGNVCKALDENFKKVRCVLWPKGALQAPLVNDETPPAWVYDDPNLVASHVEGRIQLKWNHATDDLAIYGYEIYRSADGGPYLHITTVKGVFYVDDDVVGGVRYRYWVRAYDLAGHRTPRSNIAEILIPDLVNTMAP